MPWPSFCDADPTSKVMQRHGLTRSDAKKMVRSKRNVANPNSGFYTQLRIWEECKYDIKAPISINGVKPYKKEYQVCIS